MSRAPIDKASPAILGLDHVQVAAPPGAEAIARAFYQGVLGLRERPKPQALAGRGGVWFDLPTGELHIGADADFHPALKAHPAFVTTGAGALADRVEAAGFAVVRGEDPKGRLQIYVTDPFGNRLEFVEAPPAETRLITPRLRLRPVEASDFEAYAAFVAEPAAMRFLGGAQSPTAAWRGFTSIIGSRTLNGYSMFSVIELETGRWVGRVGPWSPSGWPGLEVGWGLVPAVWGLGYATEAAEAAVDWCFDALGWDEVIHCIDPQNHPSQAVARRLGSRVLRQARMPDPINSEVDVWGQSRAEWVRRRTEAARR